MGVGSVYRWLRTASRRTGLKPRSAKVEIRKRSLLYSGAIASPQGRSRGGDVRQDTTGAPAGQPSVSQLALCGARDGHADDVGHQRGADVRAGEALSVVDL